MISCGNCIISGLPSNRFVIACVSGKPTWSREAGQVPMWWRFASFASLKRVHSNTRRNAYKKNKPRPRCMTPTAALRVSVLSQIQDEFVKGNLPPGVPARYNELILQLMSPDSRDRGTASNALHILANIAS
jgi:hypothetical protein